MRQHSALLILESMSANLLTLSASKSNASFAPACEVSVLDVPAKLMLSARRLSSPGNGQVVDPAAV
jgi:hypothetical protein